MQCIHKLWSEIMSETNLALAGLKKRIFHKEIYKRLFILMFLELLGWQDCWQNTESVICSSRAGKRWLLTSVAVLQQHISIACAFLVFMSLATSPPWIKHGRHPHAHWQRKTQFLLNSARDIAMRPLRRDVAFSNFFFISCCAYFNFF